MLKRLLPAILLVVTLLLDMTVLPLFAASVYMPVFSLLLVHALGVTLGRSRGALYGLGTGFLIDILVSTPLGAMTLVSTLLGYLGGFFARRTLKNPLWGFLSAGIGFAGMEVFLNGYIILASGQISGALFTAALMRVMINVLLTQAMIWLLIRIFNPSRSPYAAL